MSPPNAGPAVDAAEGGTPVRSAAGFELAPGEDAAVVLSPTPRDALQLAGVWALAMGAPWVLSFVVGLAGGDGVALGPLVLILLFVSVVGLCLGTFSTRHDARLVVTGRGLHLRRARGEAPTFVPWRDVVSIEPALPWSAVWRVSLRPGAALPPRPSLLNRWAPHRRLGDGELLVGDPALFDLDGSRLEAVEAAHDRWLEDHLVAGEADAGAGDVG